MKCLLMKILTFSLIFLLLIQHLRAEEINENELFQDTQTVIPVTEVTRKNQESFTKPASSPVRTSLTGDLYFTISYFASKEWLKGGNTAKNRFDQSMESNFYLDIRLKDNFKSFISFSAIYYPQGITEREKIREIDLKSKLQFPEEKLIIRRSNLRLFFREIFVDYNIRKKFYIRAGKQVANIGTCFFWNPTDLVDIEQKNFYDMTHPREGVNSIKLTWNITSWYNLYGFVTIGSETDPQNFGYLLRNEFLTGNTEWGIMVWSKRKYPVVFGGDISTRVSGVDIYGEATVSKGDYMDHLKIIPLGYKVNPYPGIEGDAFIPETVKVRDKWIYRASIDFSKTFNWELPDRIITTLEFFYNGGGYDENMFSDPLVARYFSDSGLYKPNYYGKYYTAFFGTINPLVGDNTAISLNTISNLTDKTSIINLILSYTPVYNLNLNFYLTAFIGPPDGEYTWHGSRGMLSLYTRIVW